MITNIAIDTLGFPDDYNPDRGELEIAAPEPRLPMVRSQSGEPEIATRPTRRASSARRTNEASQADRKRRD